ncbi:hypothetical protein HDU84_001634 [Entophlyctis sp. JEL0112]|nr:hypothetical protein HDU84_001634 [Entophlyctis sp. JEL0112]
MLSAFMMVTGFLVIVGGVALLFEFNTQMARERQLTEHLASYPNVVCDDDERSSSSSDSNDEMIPAFDSDEDDDSVILMNDDEDLAFNRCAKRNENFFTGIFSQKPRLALETVEVQPKRVSLTQIAETKKRHLYMQQEVIEESCDDSAKASESDHPEIQSRAVTFAIDWSSPKT